MNEKASLIKVNTSQQELHHLITVSTGFIDAYMIECDQEAPMLLPQNIVLSAMDTETNVKTIEWHDLHLPVYAVNDPHRKTGVALVIEGDEITERFALICNTMPESIRLRISEVIDDESFEVKRHVFKYVRVGERILHIPHLSHIQEDLQ